MATINHKKYCIYESESDEDDIDLYDEKYTNEIVESVTNINLQDLLKFEDLGAINVSDWLERTHRMQLRSMNESSFKNN